MGSREQFCGVHSISHSSSDTFCLCHHVENGGETEFPVCDLKCQPTEGTAILWSNVRRDEENGEWVPDPRTIHRGCPVQSGRKIGMNI